MAPGAARQIFRLLNLENLITKILEKWAFDISVVEAILLSAELTATAFSLPCTEKCVAGVLCTVECTSEQPLVFGWLASEKFFGEFYICIGQTPHNGPISFNYPLIMLLPSQDDPVAEFTTWALHKMDRQSILVQKQVSAYPPPRQRMRARLAESFCMVLAWCDPGPEICSRVCVLCHFLVVEVSKRQDSAQNAIQLRICVRSADA